MKSAVEAGRAARDATAFHQSVGMELARNTQVAPLLKQKTGKVVLDEQEVVR